jgi:hypothetical protein
MERTTPSSTVKADIPLVPKHRRFPDDEKEKFAAHYFRFSRKDFSNRMEWEAIRPAPRSKISI